MSLNDRQIKLAEAKAKGMTDVEACKEAGYKATSDRAASNQVARMMSNDEFASYLESLRTDSRSSAVKTAQEVKEGLSRLMDVAEQESDIPGYVALANRLAKMEGHDEPEKKDVNNRTELFISDEAQERILTATQHAANIEPPASFNGVEQE